MRLRDFIPGLALALLAWGFLILLVVSTIHVL